MSYRLKMHPGAHSDLDWIGMMLTDFAGARIADRIMADIEARVGQLSTLPHVGSLRGDPTLGLRVIPCDNANISFVVNDETRTVRILAITYGGGDWVSRVKERI